MNSTIQKRIELLEQRSPGAGGIRLIVHRIVSPEDPEREPDGILAAPPHLPARDREPGETWDAFIERVRALVDHLPVGEVVRVISK